jgi:hypothetical protein
MVLGARFDPAPFAAALLALPEPRVALEVVHREIDRIDGAAAMAALFFGFVAVMGIGLATRSLIVPMGIIAVFIAMFFAVPAQWVRMNPMHRPGATSLSRFASEGIQTYTGPCKARDAAVQMLIMPALVLCWGIAVVTIVAIAR